jgi:hypothetical protein
MLIEILGADFFKKASTAKNEPPGTPSAPPKFPDAAWRGIFHDYRKAMNLATEASDNFHFVALWARIAAALARRVYFSYGMRLYPNVYIICFGPTGDRKTTATRHAATALGNGIKVIAGGGSGEGICDEMAKGAPGEGMLLHAEEFSHIARPGSWIGATLLPTLTTIFDSPEVFEQTFRKNGVRLERPAASLLAGTTPHWFWRDVKPSEFEAGFGNRIFFMTGSKKPPIARPEEPELGDIIGRIESLAGIAADQRVEFDETATHLWDEFYTAWSEFVDAGEKAGEQLFVAAIQRVPSYILKLGMTYTAVENTLPVMTAEQLAAAIQVGYFGVRCVRELISLQHTGTNPRKELEQRILAYFDKNGKSQRRRDVLRGLQRRFKDVEEFNRALESLVRAEEIRMERPDGIGSTWLYRE